MEELGEVSLASSLKGSVVCAVDFHAQFRGVLGQINWLPSRTQFQSCYLFSKFASAATAPTIGDL
eukprot:8654555-Prorocentrum_lima.AAC.1